jgi:hypothetical protein
VCVGSVNRCRILTKEKTGNLTGSVGRRQRLWETQPLPFCLKKSKYSAVWVKIIHDFCEGKYTKFIYKKDRIVIMRIVDEKSTQR